MKMLAEIVCCHCCCRCFVTLGATLPQSLMKTTPETRRQSSLLVVFEVAVSSSVPASFIQLERSTFALNTFGFVLLFIFVCLQYVRVAATADGESGRQPLSFRFDKTKCVACRHDIRRLLFCRQSAHKHTFAQRTHHTELGHVSQANHSVSFTMEHSKISFAAAHFIRFVHWHVTWFSFFGRCANDERFSSS